ncbi:MAG: DUF2203 domain-containing protein [Nitrosopumilus sp.]|nr:DUF2203 domain-containing protein [Nitrosopumilus sp.]
MPKIFNQDFMSRYMFMYFTTNEANEALPDVIKKFEFALAKKNEVTKIEQQLQLSLSTTDSFEEYVTLKQKLNSVITKFYESVEILENTGVMVKSIEQGLLDFPSKRFNEEVWLCWKYGETEIRFWHDKDSGFMGRKPIEVSDESLV